MKRKALLCATVILLSIIVAQAHAVSLFFDPASTFSGTAPAGSLTAAFTDVAGGVQMVITSKLTGKENLDPSSALFLNINPALNSLLGNLTFTLTGNTGFSQAAGVLTGIDKFKADGDGRYDILFTYAPATKAFLNGESQTYLITTSSGTIVATDFTNFFSSPSGGAGTWLAAIHVQNTPGGGGSSGWVGASETYAAPTPGANWLLGGGLLGFFLLRRKFAKETSV